MSNPKVLIGTVTYQGKEYAWDKHDKAVRGLKYDNTRRLVVDNSPGSSYAKKLKQRGVWTKQAPRGQDSYEAITNSYQVLWDYMLENEDFDYLLTVESDLFPKRDQLDRLLMHDKAVVGSFYWLTLGQGKDSFQPNVMVAKPSKTSKYRLKMFAREKDEDGNTRVDHEAVEEFMNTGLRRCGGMGFGCTLLHRSVIEAFPKLQHVDFGERNKKHVDTWFYYQLVNNDIEVYVDTDTVVPHWPNAWTDEKRYFE